MSPPSTSRVAAALRRSGGGGLSWPDPPHRQLGSGLWAIGAASFTTSGGRFAPAHEVTASQRLQRAAFSRSFEERQARITSGTWLRMPGAACKTVGVDAPEEALESKLASRSRLGAAHPSADLGPISPELALVDEVLAERARMLLPDPIERARRRRVVPVASSPLVSERPESTRAPAGPQRRSRWRRTVVLAGLVFAAGAASGGFLGRKQASLPRFEARGKVRTATRAIETRTLSLPERRSDSTRSSRRTRSRRTAGTERARSYNSRW